MKKTNILYRLLPLIITFVGVPLFLWLLGDFPDRTRFFETISVFTIMTFSLLLGQFFLTRINLKFVKTIRMVNALKIHKGIGYIFVVIILVHPFLIIIPKFFDDGISPTEAFGVMITEFNGLGVILGMIGYVIVLIMLISSFFRFKLHLKYRTWRSLHGFLALIFIVSATSHVVNMGRHSNTSFSIYYVSIAVISIFFLLRTYLFKSNKKAKKNV